jgi:endonuclease YncB( thermonuclease family)
MEKKISNLDRERKEENLRKVAEKARESRIGVRSAATEGVCNWEEGE